MINILIPQDKANHVIYGYISSFIIGAIYSYITGSLFNPAWFVGAAFIVGFLKELYDYGANLAAKRKNLPPMHKVSSYDVLATTIGGVSLYLPILAWYHI